MATLSIFDVSPYIHTAEHISKYSDRKCCNFPVGGLQYFLKFLALDMKIGRHIVLCFDSKSFRKEIDKNYKGHRKPNYAVYAQLKFLIEQLERVGIPCYKLDGYEADDLVHTAVMQNYRHYDDIVIYTGDKDLAHNILDDKVSIEAVNTNCNSITKSNFLTSISKDREVLFNTVSMFKALTGDTSDNIPAFYLDDGTKGSAIYQEIFLYLISHREFNNVKVTLNPQSLKILVGMLHPNWTDADKARLDKNISLVYPKLADIQISPLKPWTFNYKGFEDLLRLVKAREAMYSFNCVREQTEEDRKLLAKKGREFISGEFAADNNLPLKVMETPSESLFLREFD